VLSEIGVFYKYLLIDSTVPPLWTVVTWTQIYSMCKSESTQILENRAPSADRSKAFY